MVLSAAGSYVVKVTIGGKMVPGWPQPLHIVPGAAVAAKSWLTGASLEVRSPSTPMAPIMLQVELCTHKHACC